MKKTELAIGDSTELMVSYHSGIAPGSINKYATISYADTATHSERITLHAQVVPKMDTTFKVELSPSSLDFTVTEGKKPKEKKLYLKNEDKEKYNLSLVDYPKEYFKIDLGKSLKPGKSMKVKVKPKRNLPEEGIKSSFTLVLEGEKKTKITVPLVYNTPPTTSQKK